MWGFKTGVGLQETCWVAASAGSGSWILGISWQEKSIRILSVASVTFKIGWRLILRPWLAKVPKTTAMSVMVTSAAPRVRDRPYLSG